jgi:hypothetical protein
MRLSHPVRHQYVKGNDTNNLKELTNGRADRDFAALLRRSERRIYAFTKFTKGDRADAQPMSSEHQSSGIELTPRLRARSAALADFIDRHALPFYGFLIAAFLCLFCAAARLLTMDADEAWILLSTAHAFGVTVPASISLGSPPVTTGAPHLVLHGLIAFATMDVTPHRAVSVIASGGLLWLAYRTLRATGSQPGVATAGTALFATVPGFLFQAGLATGEVIATASLIGAAVHWAWRGAGSVRAATVTGLLLGAAIAARVNIAPAPLALLAYVLVTRPQNAPVARRAIAAAFVSMVVAGIWIVTYYKAGQIPGAAGDRYYLATSTGLDGGKTFGQMLQAIEIANAHLPLLLIVALIGAWIYGLPRERDPTARRSSDLCGLLLFMGLAMLLAWIVIAPIPHLRYLWPAIACMWLSAVVLLMQHWRGAQRTALRLTFHALVVIACILGLTNGVVSLADGESLSLAYQAVGASPLPPLQAGQSFRSAADQRLLAAFVAGRPASASFYGFVPQVSYPITYLSGRGIRPLSALGGGGERYLIISPGDYRVWHPGPVFDGWAKTYTRPAFASGGFAALRIVDGAPPIEVNYQKLGRNDLFGSTVNAAQSHR